MDKAKLLPCPFCGGQEVHHLTPEGPDGDRVYDSVICNTCGATCNNIDTQPELDCLVAWNRRPQPPSASGEREAFEAWAEQRLVWTRRQYPDVDKYSHNATQAAWLGWQARGELAPSPGIDAAEQKPVGYVDPISIVNLTAATSDKEWMWRQPSAGLVPAYAAPPAAQPSSEWLAEAERLVDAYAKEFAQGGATYARYLRRAALLAHLRTKP